MQRSSSYITCALHQGEIMYPQCSTTPIINVGKLQFLMDWASLVTNSHGLCELARPSTLVQFALVFPYTAGSHNQNTLTALHLNINTGHEMCMCKNHL